jgi:PPOX class probable F420-dependent enzyme
MTPEERRQFVREHRTAVFGYGRRADGPAMSIVYYLMEGEEILISTMAERAKAKAVARDPKVSLCVLDEQWPPSYLQVYCEATVETDFDVVVDVMMGIAGVMAGTAMPEDARPMVAAGARVERRVALRLRPYATFHTAPRHVHAADDISPALLHSTGASIPWDADDAPAQQRARATSMLRSSTRPPDLLAFLAGALSGQYPKRSCRSASRRPASQHAQKPSAGHGTSP